MRVHWLILGLLCCVGCRASKAERPPAPLVLTPPAPVAEQPVHLKPAGEQPGCLVLTICEEESPRPADFLEKAAAYSERGDSAGAVACFNDQLKRFPDQIMIRAYLAELLLKMKKLPEA